MILVRFAIAPAFAPPENRSPGKQEASLPEWRGEVICNAMIISDDFSPAS
jgi:hypothetical protein